MLGWGGGGGQWGWGTTCLCSFSASAAKKWKFPKLIFFCILTIQDHQISYVKHVSDPIHVFHLIWVFFLGGGVPRGLGHNLLMQFSSLCSSKMAISETDLFYILTIHNDQISYIKHVLDPGHVLFTLFGCLDGGKGLGHNRLMHFFTLGSSKMKFTKLIFFYVLTILSSAVPELWFCSSGGMCVCMRVCGEPLYL